MSNYTEKKQKQGCPLSRLCYTATFSHCSLYINQVPGRRRLLFLYYTNKANIYLFIFILLYSKCNDCTI